MIKQATKAGAKAPAKKPRKTPSSSVQAYAEKAKAWGKFTDEQKETLYALIREHGLAGYRCIIIPHPPTAVGLNGRNTRFARQKWWPVLEATTRGALIDLYKKTTDTKQPGEYHVLWFYKLGVEPDDDNVWGRLKHVRDTIAAYHSMDDRQMHTGRCRAEKNKTFAGYCIVAF